MSRLSGGERHRRHGSVQHLTPRRNPNPIQTASIDRCRLRSAIDASFLPCVVCETVAEHSFVSRRDNTFREYPPASAQLAMIVPFYGELTVWIRKPDAAGWHFPTSARKAGETILEVAKRELWESARIVPPRLDLLGAIRY